MIAKLKGLVDAIGPDWTVIDVAGVGYHVFCSGRTLSALPPQGEAVTVFVETHVREDHIHLYGFATAREKEAFQILTKVQGVGAKVALAILSVLSPDQMAQAVAAQDKTPFARASGVGPKLAARLVTELKDKVGAIGVTPLPAAKAAKSNGKGTDTDVVDDAVSALVNLGYGRADAFAAVSRAMVAPDPPGSLDGIIKSGLKELSANG
jgi:Holliday junction DNA helicase RuvA